MYTKFGAWVVVLVPHIKVSTIQIKFLFVMQNQYSSIFKQQNKL